MTSSKEHQRMQIPPEKRVKILESVSVANPIDTSSIRNEYLKRSQHDKTVPLKKFDKTSLGSFGNVTIKKVEPVQRRNDANLGIEDMEIEFE